MDVCGFLPPTEWTAHTHRSAALSLSLSTLRQEEESWHVLFPSKRAMLPQINLNNLRIDMSCNWKSLRAWLVHHPKNTDCRQPLKFRHGIPPLFFISRKYCWNPSLYCSTFCLPPRSQRGLPAPCDIQQTNKKSNRVSFRAAASAVQRQTTTTENKRPNELFSIKRFVNVNVGE